MTMDMHALLEESKKAREKAMFLIQNLKWGQLY